MSRFTLPRDIYFGETALEELRRLKGHKRAMIVVGGSSMQKHGFLQQTKELLEQTGLEVQTFEGVESDPSITTVQKGAAAMRAFSPDVIVGLGGGSPIDAAKAMWVLYEHPNLSFEDLQKPFSYPALRKKAIFVAIPSTSGTASEVTAFSVITDYDTGIKYPLADFEITPDIAILDFRLPMTMPHTLTANTGMDALTHAIEAFTASNRSPISDALSLEAISDIMDYLPLAVEGNAKARARLHIAQCMAGMAFSNALLGIAHSLAHKTGATLHLPHGLCNAIFLPHVIRYNAAVCKERYARIAQHLGLSGNTDEALTQSLIAKIKSLTESVGIFPTLAENGVSREAFDRNAKKIAQNALCDPCTSSNPRPADEQGLLGVLIAAYGE